MSANLTCMLLTVMIKLFGFYSECRLVIGTPVGAVRPGPDPFPGRTNYQFSFLSIKSNQSFYFRQRGP